MRILYKYLTLLLSPLIYLYLKYRQKKGKEHVERFSERLGHPSKTRPDGPLIWFHGASVGETLSVIPLIHTIKESFPTVNILMTSGTVTSAALIEKRLGDEIIHQFFPVDVYTWSQRFINYWKPDSVFWVDSDFWPNMLSLINERDIPAALINARVGKHSSDKWKKAAQWSKYMMDTYQFALAQTDQDAQNIKDMGLENVEIIGNLKFASPALPFDKDVHEELKGIIGNKTIITFASTHPNEEPALLDHLDDIMKSHPDIFVMLVPRHPHRGDEIKALVDEYGFKNAQRSKKETIESDTAVYIGDTLGEMGLYYKLSDIVIIGGSFVTHGGQNPIEATHLDCAIVYGPHMFNFKEICAQLEGAEAIIKCEDDKDLKSTLTDLLEQPEKKAELKKRSYDLSQKNLAIKDSFFDRMKPIIKAAM